MASSTKPCSTPRRQHFLHRVAQPSRACDDNSISTYQGCAIGERIAQLWPWRTQKSMPIAAMSSKLVTVPPARSLASLSRASAASGEFTPTNAVSTERGRGNSFSTAAVMMPSVPSAPMNRLLQVVAGVVLLQLGKAVARCARRPAPLRGRAPGRARRHRRARAVPPALVERLPPMVQLPSAPSDSGNRRSASAAACCALASTTPASQVMVLDAASISRMRSSRVSDSTISPSCGVCPPTRPVLPPCGTIAVPVSLASLQDRRNFRGRAGPQHERRAARDKARALRSDRAP